MTPMTIYLFTGTIVMAIVTFLTRTTPLILPKRLLNSAVFNAINQGLPLAVMTLLVLTSLSWYDANKHFIVSPLLIAQCLALIIVLLSYHFWKQLFVSMLVGIASLNLFLWLFN